MIEKSNMDGRCVTALISLTIGFLGLTAMFLNYKAKFERKSITLEKNDHQNEQRIKHLEREILELKNKYDRR